MKIIPVRDFLQALHDLHPAPVSPVGDDELVCPSLDWVKTKFIPWMLPQMPSYQLARFDCENYAIRGHDRFSECLRSSLDNEFIGKGEAFCRVAVELFSPLNNVPAAGNRRHALNLFMDDTGELWFLEPQNGQLTNAKQAVKAGVCRPYYYGII